MTEKGTGGCEGEGVALEPMDADTEAVTPAIAVDVGVAEGLVGEEAGAGRKGREWRKELPGMRREGTQYVLCRGAVDTRERDGDEDRKRRLPAAAAAEHHGGLYRERAVGAREGQNLE